MAKEPLTGAATADTGAALRLALFWQGRELPWLRWSGLLLVVLLLAMPLLLLGMADAAMLQVQYIEVKAHALVELFCGLVALMIAVLIFAINTRRRYADFWLFGAAFLAMGILDILHAFSNPFTSPYLFVLLHTLSTLSGGILILVGVVTHRMVPQHWRPTGKEIAASALVVAAVVAVVHTSSLLSLVESSVEGYVFSQAEKVAHELAALFYLVAALGLYAQYRKQGPALPLAVAALLLLFAESAYLFGYSGMWNAAWWLWHGIKVLFYISILFMVLAGYLWALRQLEESRGVLKKANQYLTKAQSALKCANEELMVRNRMAKEAISAEGLDNTLAAVYRALNQVISPARCKLVLTVSPDEVCEMQLKVNRWAAAWPIRVLPLQANARLGGSAAERLAVCPAKDHPEAAPGAQQVALALQAGGAPLGYLEVELDAGEPPADSYGQLQRLAAEVGPIINNALLHQSWSEACRFQSALFRLSSLLTSTLDLDQVLQAVCRESARLFDSDGAVVWLLNGASQELVPASSYFGEGIGRASAEGCYCEADVLGANLLRRYKLDDGPRAFLWHELASDPAQHPDRQDGWGALAVFPLLEEGRLIGLMGLFRAAQVQYSRRTLEKGALLAGQVRIAISNARTYENLCDLNAQLQAAEESKLRSERLAVLGQLAATVAHEVRNPVSAIANCVAVLKVACGGAERTDMALQIIGHEIRRLDKLTRDFLSFGKGSRRVVSQVDLTELVRGVCAGLEQHIRHEEAEISVEQRVLGNGRIMFDADGLQEVLWNLLLNGVQATGPRGRVFVRAAVKGRALLIVVGDSGRGIALDDRQRVFEPFYSQRPQGAGLGLAIVRRFVSEWQGRIRIWSRPGAGTRFFLRMPLTEVNTDSGRRSTR